MARGHLYSDEKNTQIVIALLKAHGIKNVVISPGATNDRFVLSVQGDEFFNLYSAIDERHAGYLACGISQAKGCPVVINCTGATASRNYMPALTEAFYRKLPILAITCSQRASHIGNMYPQMTDRLHLPNDIANLSIQCPVPRNKEDEWACGLNVNRAILELTHHGGGPVHINLETDFNGNYTTEQLPCTRVVRRTMPSDVDGWPTLNAKEKIVIWIGAHAPFTSIENDAIMRFVNSHNVVVLTDITSNYSCVGAIRGSLLLSQEGCRDNPAYDGLKPDLIIHIGEISGDYPTYGWLKDIAPVWRVNEDGELRDPLMRLEHVFEMSEGEFFRHYSGAAIANRYLDLWNSAINDMREHRLSIPFSNLWIANELAPRIPEDAVLHLGILNPLRCWNLTNCLPQKSFCLTGGFGIDGGLSSMIGSSIGNSNAMHYGIFGDLSFYYDLNAIGSRHLGKNLRILVINNGEGGEFTIPGSIWDNPNCGEKVHDYIAARGHFGRGTKEVIKKMAEAFGFDYFSASNKEEFARSSEKFMNKKNNKSIILECFTTVEDERSALNAYRKIRPYTKSVKASAIVSGMIPGRIKNIVKVALGRNGDVVCS